MPEQERILLDAIRDADAQLRDMWRTAVISLEEDRRIFDAAEQVRVDLRAALMAHGAATKGSR